MFTVEEVHQRGLPGGGEGWSTLKGRPVRRVRALDFPTRTTDRPNRGLRTGMRRGTRESRSGWSPESCKTELYPGCGSVVEGVGDSPSSRRQSKSPPRGRTTPNPDRRRRTGCRRSDGTSYLVGCCYTRVCGLGPCRALTGGWDLGVVSPPTRPLFRECIVRMSTGT